MSAATRLVILHGAHGGPDTNWFPWLAAALEPHGIETLRPRFPTPGGQSLPAWLDAYDRVLAPLPPAPTILVGHSLGAVLALRLAERAARPLAGLFLAAGFLGALGLPDYDPISRSFFAEPFDWPAIGRNKGTACRCWASDDDLMSRSPARRTSPPASARPSTSSPAPATSMPKAASPASLNSGTPSSPPSDADRDADRSAEPG